MAGNPGRLLLYIGTTALVGPGDPVPPGAKRRTDRAAALADAWAEAGETGRVPRVYQVSDGVIGAAVLPSGAMAWAALTVRRRDSAAARPDGGQP